MNMKNLKKLLKKKKVIIGIGIVAVIIAIFFVMFFFMVFGSYNGLGMSRETEQSTLDMSYLTSENGFYHYEDENYKSFVGIDVSTFQKDIDWDKVGKSGVDFVMIRLGYRGTTDGLIYMDDKFEENLKGAKAAGLSVGVYFFSHSVNVDEAMEDAKFVVRHIRGKGVDLPIAFDMEPINGQEDRISGLTSTQRTEIADAFCTIIERNGHDAMIYGNQTWLNSNIDLSFLTSYEIWLAQYDEVTNYENRFLMWQYSNSGQVDGISTNVDLNIMFKKK